jgi:hypothetical protein
MWWWNRGFHEHWIEGEFVGIPEEVEDAGAEVEAVSRWLAVWEVEPACRGTQQVMRLV